MTENTRFFLLGWIAAWSCVGLLMYIGGWLK